jgi:hypothetical protein
MNAMNMMMASEIPCPRALRELCMGFSTPLVRNLAACMLCPSLVSNDGLPIDLLVNCSCPRTA